MFKLKVGDMTLLENYIGRVSNGINTTNTIYCVSQVFLNWEFL